MVATGTHCPCSVLLPSNPALACVAPTPPLPLPESASAVIFGCIDATIVSNNGVCDKNRPEVRPRPLSWCAPLCPPRTRVPRMQRTRTATPSLGGASVKPRWRFSLRSSHCHPALPMTMWREGALGMVQSWRSVVPLSTSSCQSPLLNTRRVPHDGHRRLRRTCAPFGDWCCDRYGASPSPFASMPSWPSCP